MNRTIATALCLAALGTTAAFAADTETGDLMSERGAPIEAGSPPPERRRIEIVTGGFGRTFAQQPPMIPHPIDKYEISLRLNGCLKCHSDTTYIQENAKRAPDSHYLDREGNRQERISSLRYFCTQCHAVQLTGQPPVANTFEGY